jgi:hypothetical protein
MIPTTDLKYSRMADIPVGNLLYYLREGQPAALALCIEHPETAGTGVVHLPLVLVGLAGRLKLPLIIGNARNARCIDLGLKASIMLTHPIAAILRNTQHQLGPGYLLLSNTRLAVNCFYEGGMQTQTYWDVRQGLEYTVGPDDFVFIVQWELGVVTGDGHFRKLVAYPEDYTIV